MSSSTSGILIAHHLHAKETEDELQQKSSAGCMNPNSRSTLSTQKVSMLS